MITGTIRAPAPKAQKVLSQFQEAEMAAIQDCTAIVRQIITATIGLPAFGKERLKAMGYPYAVRNPHPPGPAGEIHMDSGEFYRSVMIVGPARIGYDIVQTVYTTDEDRAWQLQAGGGSDMMNRPYKTLLQARVRRAIAGKFQTSLIGYVKIKVRG